MADIELKDYMGGLTTDTAPLNVDTALVRDTSTGELRQVPIENIGSFVPTFLMRFFRPDYHIVAADVNAAAETISVPSHRLATGTRGAFDTTWGGFTSGTSYYVIVVDADTIKLADSYSDAKAGVARNITSTPGGTVIFTSTNGHHIYAGKMHQLSSEMTYSFGDSAVDPSTDTITLANHQFETGHGIQFSSTWGGVSSGTLYYAIKVDANTIKVATTYLNAIAGTAVNITADPGGTVSLFGTYGDFYADALVTPRLGAEYVFSVGYGGSHILLFGFDGGSGGRIDLTGNLSVAAGGSIDIAITSGTDQAFIGHPVHIAVLRYVDTVVVLMNGVPCKRFTKATGRGAFDAFDASMYIGGSDHSNFEGDIYWVRYFEHRCPFYYTPSDAGALRVTPRPLASYYESVSNRYVTANLLLNFSQPATTIPNLGQPLVPGRTNHGHRAAGQDADIFQDFNSYEESELPQQIRTELPAKPSYGLTPTAVPVGAKIFDSFKRDDVVYLWQSLLGLGSTEGGSLGVKRWQQTDPAAPLHGILFGRAFVSGSGGNTTREYVTSNSAFMKVEIVNNGAETIGAVLFAAYDFTANTGLMAIHGGADTISIFKVVTGTPTSLGNYVIPGDNVPYTLGIEYTSGKHCKLLIDGVTQVDYDDSASSALTGTQAGFTSSVGYCRFENFAVY